MARELTRRLSRHAETPAVESSQKPGHLWVTVTAPIKSLG